MREVKLLTLRVMDPFVRFRIGGLVVSRSVKYLGEAFRSTKRPLSSRCFALLGVTRLLSDARDRYQVCS